MPQGELRLPEGVSLLKPLQGMLLKAQALFPPYFKLEVKRRESFLNHQSGIDLPLVQHGAAHF